MTFQERAKIAIEVLKRQPKVTLEQAREQVRQIKAESAAKAKKQGPIK